MKPRWIALVLLAALAALGPGCTLWYGIAKPIGLMSPPKFSVRKEIPQDFKLSVAFADYADPPADYTVVVERTGKVSYEVVVRSPHRREQSGVFEITEEQVLGLWKAIAAAKFDELDERYPRKGDGADVGMGVQKYFVRADAVERRVESHYQFVKELDSIRSAFVAVVPKDVMEAKDAMVGTNKSGVLIGDTATKVFHLPDCPVLKDVPEQRRQKFTSQYDALNYNFTPCPDCAPLRAKAK